MKNDERKEAIVQAAIKAFSEKGYAAASTREIADAAGVSIGTMFRHFKNKEEILYTLMEEITRNVLPKLLVESVEVIFSEYIGKTPEEALRALIGSRIRLLNEHFELFKVVFAESFYHTELREIVFQEVVLPIEKLIENFINNGIKTGYFRNINPSTAASYIVGSMIYMNIENKCLERMNAEQLKDEFIDLLFHGISEKQL